MLTVAEVAPLLRVCKATVYRMVKDGSLQAVHVLNGVRIRRSAIEGRATRFNAARKHVLAKHGGTLKKLAR